ncbi:MAG: hypothetical protein A3F47_01480 [Candidatus Staskawiczbacteria bacterium RIFCSPHIGHO2_12_FULL_38_11]|uniref:Type II secretion system protein GspF domain-containing protein n=1 Tax=Candidatus Staskawiczbacteria bacterium RIFCSPHIGHO2_12_FULL_38_11 TaxID=1802209 RepID=A0A1G2I7A6_9BACT|nr:MAG: hypothetical protein A3F47_01480 [Candidatus Staskawiczbacteria bacterium RIFCSPHIGHO2_12_FULL_38_11]
MPNYNYIAKNFEGKTETGIMNASNESQLAQALKSQGMILIKASIEEKKAKLNFDISIPFLGVSSTQKLMMVKNLGIMFSTGLSLVKIFDILSIQAKGKVLKSALIDIKEKINKGENLSEAMARYPKIFSNMFVSMIKVGEESGTLEGIFQILSLQISKEHELKSKIRNAMTYPAVIVVVMFIIGGIIITVVLPNLATFFANLNADIPIYTKILLWIGVFLSKNWYLLLVIPIVLGISIFLTIRTKRGKFVLDTILLKTPLISPIVKKNNSAFFVRSLSSMISSGVPLVRSLEITSETVGNHYFKDAIIDASTKIKKGDKLSSALRPYQNLFPFGVIEMVEVGEETGKTSEILKKLAEFYEQEAVSAVERLSILIEPMLIIVLGLAVGFFAFSIIQPMYSSLQAVSR